MKASDKQTPQPSIRTILDQLNIPEKEQNAFIAAATERRYPRNSYMITEKAVCDKFIFVTEGILCHGIPTAKGENLVRNFLVAPGFGSYSIYSFLSGQPSWNFCKALTDITVLEWSHETYNRFSENPLWNNFFHRLLIKFIMMKEMRELMMSQEDAVKRYFSFLKEYPNLLNRIPQHYIASYLKIKPQSLSRIKNRSIKKSNPG